ncbi:MAG: cupin domain-containing protein [Clostridiaceae bacterium]|nr:cupin domain-containing protein [Clostridiaceae bacterium]
MKELESLSRDDFPTRIFHIPDIHKYCNTEAKKTIFCETDFIACAVWCMHPGQELPIHSHKAADDIWVVLKGQADYFPETGKKVLIKAGDIIVARPGEKHGMKNNYDEDFLMLGFAGPVPIGFIPEKLYEDE